VCLTPLTQNCKLLAMEDKHTSGINLVATIVFVYQPHMPLCIVLMTLVGNQILSQDFNCVVL